jgi:hypothetical protein
VLNRLLATFPAALAIAADELGRPTFLRLLERWRTANALVTASRGELVVLTRATKHGWPERLADRITQALGTARSRPRPAPI